MRTRNEHGAVAIFIALLAVMLMGVASLAVDLGNGIARKSDVQGQADFAALAAGALIGTQTSGPVPTPVLQAAMDRLNSNRVLNDDGTCRPQSPCVASLSDLTDGDLANGEVRFCSGLNAPAAGCRKAGLQVVAPTAQVDFGFAGVFGAKTMNVQGTATVGAFSPVGTLPLYAASGCDYGRQTLADPSNGSGTPLVVPTLAFPTDNNGADMLSVNPTQVALNASNANLAVNVQGPDHVIRVGFFRAGLANPIVVDIVQDPVLNPTVPVNGNNSYVATINVTIPTTVTSVEDIWWVRVYSGPGASNAHQNQWSPNADAIPLRIGASVLECGAGSTDGNFGSLSLDRTSGSTNDTLALNIIDLEPPTGLVANVDPAITTLTAECTAGLASSSPATDANTAVITDLPNPGQKDNTNCVSTDTGLPANAATAGFITGVGGTKGRLRDKPTASGCSPTGNSNYANITLQSTTYQVNNDTLSCFLLDGFDLQQVSAANYNSGTAFSEAIFKSPRFFYVPVLKKVPLSGSSNFYWVVDFRPAFLTDETVASTTTRTSPDTATSENGLHIEQNQVKSIKVVFFNINALPDRTDGAVQRYIGVGRPILRLVD